MKIQFSRVHIIKLSMNETGYISPSKVTDFSLAAKIFNLLLAAICVVINFTILFKLLMKPHLWSLLNALICILLSKSTSQRVLKKGSFTRVWYSE